VTGRGRPIRFLVAVVGGWVGVRAALLWPVAAVLPEVARVLVPRAAAEEVNVRHVARVASPVLLRPRPAGTRRAPSRTSVMGIGPVLAPGGHAPASPARFAGRAAPVERASPAEPVPLLPGISPPPVFRASRWSGSGWAIVRPGGRATPFASQLGGSQAGLRLAYALDDARRVAVYGRVSAAFDSRQQEGAIGLDWRPTRAPVHLVLERRIGIAGIKGGTAAGVIGGIGPTAIGAGLRLEGYGQAGAILRDRVEGFADGSARVTQTFGPVDLGLGAWGAAQRGAARLDLGPTIGVAVPVAGRTFRLTADWRQRVAGDARPGSGPAVSVGVDF
jgi:hypothetical protein